ncbi:hypothetical protein OPV22_032299 [Ensete ventricosum]|uniref:Uncharacterized protein n=1 Tax=Ensete ventricosum TaxID=4639 RepID=A0AAV8PR60_ENSVE|nr:hypothetical protein OPV22_032299 [Ensete ventricosum]
MHVKPYPPQLVIHDDDTTKGNPLNISLKLPINLFLATKIHYGFRPPSQLLPSLPSASPLCPPELFQCLS